MAITFSDIAATGMQLDRHDEIAAALSVGRFKTVSHIISERGILEALGAVDGDLFLSSLENVATDAGLLPEPLQPYYGSIRRGVAWLKADGLDVGAKTTRQLLDALASARILNALSVETIKSLAERSDPVSISDVAHAVELGV